MSSKTVTLIKENVEYLCDLGFDKNGLIKLPEQNAMAKIKRMDLTITKLRIFVHWRHYKQK